jgi:hypothetical protein
VRNYQVARVVDNSHLCLSTYDEVALEEDKSAYLLTVHVNVVELVTLVDIQTKNITLDISKCQYLLVSTGCQTDNLVFMVVEILLIVQHVSNIPETLDGAVPGGTHELLPPSQIDHVVD